MGLDVGFLFFNIYVHLAYFILFYYFFRIMYFIIFVISLVLLEAAWPLLKFVAFYQALVGSLCTAVESPRAELHYWMLKNSMNVQR